MNTEEPRLLTEQFESEIALRRRWLETQGQMLWLGDWDPERLDGRLAQRASGMDRTERWVPRRRQVFTDR
jgi:hypothetical protein